jgi:TPR repeat protein
VACGNHWADEGDLLEKANEYCGGNARVLVCGEQVYGTVSQAWGQASASSYGNTAYANGSSFGVTRDVRGMCCKYACGGGDSSVRTSATGQHGGEGPAQGSPGLVGCQKDTDCKADRVCEEGRCVSLAAPKPATSEAPNSAPSSQPPTEARGADVLDASTAEERCAKGDGATCDALGQAFLTGQGAKQSDGEALTLFLKACDKKSADGCGSASILLNKSGMGSQAANLTNRACELGAGSYCCHLDDNCPGETRCKSGRCVAP